MTKAKAKRGPGGKFLPVPKPDATAGLRQELATLAAANAIAQRALGAEVERLRLERDGLQRLYDQAVTRLRCIRIALDGLDDSLEQPDERGYVPSEAVPAMQVPVPIPVQTVQMNSDAEPPVQSGGSIQHYPRVTLPPAPAAMADDMAQAIENMRAQAAAANANAGGR